MDKQRLRTPLMACRENSRRAISLLEITIVVAIVSLLGIAAISRYGHESLGNGNAEGFARKLALSLVHARRSTIATGDNHFVQLTSSGGSIASFELIRRTSSGNVQVDESRNVPQDVTVTSTASQLEFDFEGAALGTYSVTVAGPDRAWVVSTFMLTGAVQVTELP